MGGVIKWLAVALVSLVLAAALLCGVVWLALTEPLHFLVWALAVAVVAMACHIGSGIFAVVKWARAR